MAKYLIYDADGNIVRTINLPYKGTHVDISVMTDAEFDDLLQNQQGKKIDLNADGTHKKDGRGLPVIKNKGKV